MSGHSNKGRMSIPKPGSKRKKMTVTAPDKDDKKQPDREPATDGLTGQGADSVIPHLRNFEQKRKDRSTGNR